MIKLNNKTQQDFLNRKWAQRLLDAGVNMSDANYCIVKDVSKGSNVDVVCSYDQFWYNAVPTYTLSELLYKLHEWVEVTIDGVKYAGGLELYKDSPFYIACYSLRNKFTNEGEVYDTYLHASCDYPIESLASLLIQCHEKGIGSVEDISSK